MSCEGCGVCRWRRGAVLVRGNCGIHLFHQIDQIAQDIQHVDRFGTQPCGGCLESLTHGCQALAYTFDPLVHVAAHCGVLLSSDRQVKVSASGDVLKLELPAGQMTHVLRHTFASHYMMNGGDILTLQRVLGHASLAMTMKYAHFSPGHLAEVVKLNPLSFGLVDIGEVGDGD